MLFITNCTEANDKPIQKLTEKTNWILPFEIELGGVLREIEDVQNSVPKIRLLIDVDSITITVGATEKYYVNYESTEFPKLIPHLDRTDFKTDEYFYNPYLEHGGKIKLIKEIDQKKYVKTITNFKRRDIEVKYNELDSIGLFKSYHLSRIANDIAIPFIKDNVDKNNRIVANSMTEALQNPEKVYELKLRDSKTTSLPPEIGQLINLRILDISGSRITEIPTEIENCKHLKSIIANASRLSKIPKSIGNLKKLRVLNLGYCKITTVPEELGNVTSLWSLILGANQLNSLPASFSQLKNLTFFSAALNKLTEFPKATLGMDSVGNLWLHGNDIKHFPVEIKNMKRLHHLLVNKDVMINLKELEMLIPHVRIIHQD